MKKMIRAGDNRNWPSEPSLTWCYNLRDPAQNACLQDKEITSKAREVRSYIGWNLFPVPLVGPILWIPGHKNVPRNDNIHFATTIAHYSIIRIIL